MPTPHKNKTFTTFIAAVFGGLGIHRFYLYGRKDLFGWLHWLTLPVSLLAIALLGNLNPMFAGMLFILSILSGFLEALVIGLTPMTNGTRNITQAAAKNPNRTGFWH